MNRINCLLALCIFASAGLVVAQTPNVVSPCAHEEVRDRHLLQNPGLQSVWDQAELHTQQMAAQAGTRNGSPVYQIPVVVHVLYNSAFQNLSTALIQSQIDVLNEDFRRTNPDASSTRSQWQGIAGDAGIEFCLATIDPQGLPTTGITRTATNVQTFSVTTDNIKSTALGGRDPWPTSDYMNIWVGNLSPGLLGYATLPGTPGIVDGVVVTFGDFGRPGVSPSSGNGIGRTCTHEVGHYFNLLHLWGNSTGSCAADDGVADTPSQIFPNFGCGFPLPQSCASLDMFQNYMDYTNGTCKNLFTQGQVTRMRATLAVGGLRRSLVNSPAACGNLPGPAYQVNTADAVLNINSAVGSATVPAQVSVGVGATAFVNMGSSTQGQAWDLGAGLLPLVPNGSLTASDGQLVNLDLSDPSLFMLWNGFQSPPFATTTLPFVPQNSISLSVQFANLSAARPSGIALSAPTRLNVP